MPRLRIDLHAPENATLDSGSENRELTEWNGERGKLSYGWKTLPSKAVRFYIWNHGSPNTRDSAAGDDDIILLRGIGITTPEGASIEHRGRRHIAATMLPLNGGTQLRRDGELVWTPLDRGVHKDDLPQHTQVPESSEYFYLRGGNRIFIDYRPEGVGFATPVPDRASQLLADPPAAAAVFRWFGIDPADAGAAGRLWPAYGRLVGRMDAQQFSEDDFGWWMTEKWEGYAGRRMRGLAYWGCIQSNENDSNGHLHLGQTLMKSWLHSLVDGPPTPESIARSMRVWQIVYAHMMHKLAFGIFATDDTPWQAWWTAYEKAQQYGMTGNNQAITSDADWSHQWPEDMQLYAMLSGCPDAEHAVHQMKVAYCAMDPARAWNGAAGARKAAWFLRALRGLHDLYSHSPNCPDPAEWRADLAQARTQFVDHVLTVTRRESPGPWIPNRNADEVQPWQQSICLAELYEAIKAHDMSPVWEDEVKAMIDYAIDRTHQLSHPHMGGLTYGVPYRVRPGDGEILAWGDEPQTFPWYVMPMLAISASWRGDADDRLQRIRDSYLPRIGLSWSEHVAGDVAQEPDPTYHKTALGPGLLKVYQAPHFVPEALFLP